MPIQSTHIPLRNAEAPFHDRVADAVGDLETPLCDALNMARITALLIEQVRLETVDGRRQMLLQEARAETLVWAIYQTETMFKAAHAAWDEVNDLAFDLRREG